MPFYTPSSPSPATLPRLYVCPRPTIITCTDQAAATTYHYHLLLPSSSSRRAPLILTFGLLQSSPSDDTLNVCASIGLNSFLFPPPVFAASRHRLLISSYHRPSSITTSAYPASTPPTTNYSRSVPHDMMTDHMSSPDHESMLQLNLVSLRPRILP